MKRKQFLIKTHHNIDGKFSRQRYLVLKISWIRIRFVLRGWFRFRIRIRSISNRTCNPAIEYINSHPLSPSHSWNMHLIRWHLFLTPSLITFSYVPRSACLLELWFFCFTFQLGDNAPSQTTRYVLCRFIDIRSICKIDLFPHLHPFHPPFLL